MPGEFFENSWQLSYSLRMQYRSTALLLSLPVAGMALFFDLLPIRVFLPNTVISEILYFALGFLPAPAEYTAAQYSCRISYHMALFLRSGWCSEQSSVAFSEQSLQIWVLCLVNCFKLQM